MLKYNNYGFYIHLLTTLIFIYIFYQLLIMKKTNIIYYIWSKYILNKYCFIIYILLSLFIYTKDNYIGILLLVLAVASFKTASKEFFNSSETVDPINTSLQPTKIIDGNIIADIPRPTATTLEDSIKSNELINAQVLGEDNRFKIDDIAVKDILRQIKSQVDFDPYKTELDKNVIYEIYNKYFDNDIFIKLKNNNDDSASYLASGNFNYLPTTPKVDYDIVSYQNHTDNLQFGINPLVDGISNKTKINRS